MNSLEAGLKVERVGGFFHYLGGWGGGVADGGVGDEGDGGDFCGGHFGGF